MKVGRRLAIKILNASRFVLSMTTPPAEVTEPIDLGMLASLRRVVDEATEAFETYEHARALEVTEHFFWGWTDDYLELVKQRAYGTQGPDKAGSAVAALQTALDVFLRLFAPFLVFVTEEVWSWWREGSVHRAPWPTAAELPAEGNPEVYEVAAAVLTEIRKEKASSKVSLKAQVDQLKVSDTAERLALLELARDDVVEAGVVQLLVTHESDSFSVVPKLAVHAG
jgi:valyl-tRNA synthetase